MSARRPNAVILKPWMRSSEVSTKVSGWPTLPFTVSGVNSNLLAATLTSLAGWAARRTTPPAALPISSAANTLRFMGLSLGDRQLGDRDLGAHRHVARAERCERGVERRRRRAVGGG